MPGIAARTLAWAADLFARVRKLRYEGIAIASRIPKMMITTRSSINVKPSSRLAGASRLESRETIGGSSLGECARGARAGGACGGVKESAPAADEPGRREMPESFLSIDALLERMVARNASDLHITVGTPPAMRVHGALERYEDIPELTPEDTHQMLYRILSTEQQKHLEIKRQIDFAHSIPGLARFRVNVFFQRGTLGAAFRLIPADIKTLEGLGSPS